MKDMASENASEEDPTQLCDPCTFRGIDTQAVTRCDECIENLCDSCEEIHRSFKATRSHKLKPFSDRGDVGDNKRTSIPQFMQCEEHSTETVTLYCADHKQVACTICQLTLHRKCTMTNLKKIAGERRSQDEAVRFFDRLPELLSELEKIRNRRNDDKATVEDCSRSYKADVEKFKAYILNWLDNLEKRVEKQIVEKEKELLDNIDNHINTSNHVMQQLDEILRKYRNIGEQDQTWQFTLMMKKKEKVGHWETIKDEIIKEIKPINFGFQKSNTIEKMITMIDDLGMFFQVDFPTVDINFLNISSVRKREDITCLSHCVTGCDVMPDGKIVIIHGHSEDRIIKVLTTDFKVSQELKFEYRIWDVSAIAHQKIVITGGESKRLYFFDISKGIVKTKSIDVGIDCRGIACKNDLLYVSSIDQNEVRVLTMDGKPIQTFTINEGEPYYLAVGNTDGRIATSTNTASSVLCKDVTGNLMFRYSESPLRAATGLLFDNEDNFLLCGFEPCNIHVVKRNGSRDRILLNYNEGGLVSPHCLAYRPVDRTLLIGQRFKPHLLIFDVILK